MNKIHKSLLALVVVAAVSGASSARAFGISTTTVTKIQVVGGTGPSQWVAVFFASNLNVDSCTVKNAMYFDVSTEKGKAFISLANAAMLARATVDAAGTSTCMTPSGGVNADTGSTLTVHAP